LVKDIRFHDSDDDVDEPLRARMNVSWNIPPDQAGPYSHFTLDNHRALQFSIDNFKQRTGRPLRTILEIGVGIKFFMDHGSASTSTLLKNLDADGKYLGIDIQDSSHVHDPNKGIHTMIVRSEDIATVRKKMLEIGINEIDYLFIDGWHSINQVLKEWEYTQFLSPGAVVGWHDTKAHPGPYLFLRNLDKNKWVSYENLCPNDYGFGYCYRKN
jgi:hypothetical protein